jgi:hypothetical protein
MKRSDEAPCSVDNVELSESCTKQWPGLYLIETLHSQVECFRIERTVPVSRFSVSCCNQCTLPLLMIRLSRCEAARKEKKHG